MNAYTVRDALLQIKQLTEAALISSKLEIVVLEEVLRIATHAMSHAKLNIT